MEFITMTITSQRRVSYERAAEIYRAIECKSLPTDREVSIEEAEGYTPAEQFGEFLEVNRQTVQLYEAPADYAKQVRVEAFEREADYWRHRGFSEEAADEIAHFAVGTDA